ncbi:hypothetical protein [Pseudoalteromonas denitrificans]|uniref:DUF4397 domain-containing protein n=1 Tax=Pseudoalteromonas denitrificans DSM 6059 TaxID=1123010 RepID=A0A1I1RZI4_9GAMM|nr:hypothetical protein [Pseudoalteromonas denitrificans]SFD39739.1 hypothetical protein SAMN02745724_04397 [Pseudoalteromonas denitrificans DSM 6059]
MKASILALITTGLILTGCDNDETYNIDITAINLVNNELNVVWFDKNNDQEILLSPDSSLEYGQVTNEQTLYQDENHGSAYSFKATDGNSLENIIEKTNFAFTHDENYVLFAYGKENNTSEQKAALGAVFLDNEGIAQNQYRVILLHTFPSEMGMLDIYIENKLVAEDISYSKGTNHINSNIDNVHLKVTKADSIEPILEYTIEPTSGKFHAIFIAPKATDDNNAAAFIVIDK